MPALSNFPQGFAGGLILRGIPLVQSHPGNVFWVSNSPVIGGGPSHYPTRNAAGANGNPGTFNKPFSTLDYAFSQCLQGNGDIIFVKNGHKETLSNATALALDCSDVAVIGLGSGSARPTFTLDTATTANIPLRGTNISLQNLLFRANFADIASFITAATFSVTASIATTVLTVTVVGSGTIYPGMGIAGTGIIPGTKILYQISGTTGGVGTYKLDISQTFASGTVTGLTQDFNLEGCEFRDTTSVLNALTVFTSSATANAVDGLRIVGNKVSSLGTTAATTAFKVTANTARLTITDNYGVSAVLNDTAAMLAAGSAQFISVDIARNRWVRPNTSSTGGSFVSGSGNAWTGLAADNYFWQVDGSAGIWIATGHGTSMGYFQNFSPITGAADVSGLINPAAA